MSEALILGLGLIDVLVLASDLFVGGIIVEFALPEKQPPDLAFLIFTIWPIALAIFVAYLVAYVLPELHRLDSEEPGGGGQ